MWAWLLIFFGAITTMGAFDLEKNEVWQPQNTAQVVVGMVLVVLGVLLIILGKADDE